MPWSRLHSAYIPNFLETNLTDDSVEERLSSLTEESPPCPFYWRSRFYALAGLLILAILVAALAATVGPVSLPFTTVWKVILSKLSLLEFQADWATETIVWESRLPRIALAGAVGMALAVAGATYQGLFRNPLADPYLLGVAHGALLGATAGFLYLADWGGTIATTPVMSFVGAILAMALVYFVSRVGGTLPVTTLILSGVAVGTFLHSIQAYMLYKADEKQHIIGWMFGDFNLTTWEEVGIALPLILIGVMFIWMYARSLNVMQFDEEQAQQLGINVERVKVILLIAATMVTALAVCFCGIIGFVGIIVPHAVRLVWGPDHRFLLPLSALVGAIFLITVETLARTVLGTPPGILTAALGAPFFIYLLRRKRSVVF